MFDREQQSAVEAEKEEEEEAVFVTANQLPSEHCN